MNHEIISGQELLSRLKKKISSEKPTKMAVAFWGLGAAAQLGLSNQSDAKVICNLESGGTNPDEIRALLNLNIDVRQHDRLHAKIGIVGDSFSFVGSSNISANGLGFEGNEATAWEESNVAFDHVDSGIAVRFESLWGSASDITEEDLQVAENAWRSRQKANRSVHRMPKADESFIGVVLNDPSRLSAYNTHVVVYPNLCKEDEDIIENANTIAQDCYGSQFEVYWDWEELPEDAVLIDFRKPSRGRLAFVGVYRRHPDFSDFEEGGEQFQVAYHIEDIDGIKLGQETEILKKAVGKYLQDHQADNAYCFPISELKEYLIHD